MMRSNFVTAALCWVFLIGASHTVLAQTAGTSPGDLADMSLEELLRITVTTASRKSESLFDAPAIMAVVTEADIQAYGGRSLVEVLDRTTSVYFMGTQENLHGALTMRGDATLGANNHILVLVNGRPIQESTHGGMIYPFLRAFPLASVQQIEVIRGPGSVLYGTNAYVGVINVITKDWNSTGVAGASFGSFDTRAASAAGGTRFGNIQVSGGIAFFHDEGWDFTATDSIDEDKLGITRTVPWLDRSLGMNLNARYKDVSLDVTFAKTEAPHLTNSTATTSWARYGLSNAAQSMVNLGYKRRLSQVWTSSVNATHNRFFEQADFGEIGKREILSNNFVVEWANELSVTNQLQTVFGANVSRSTGSFFESTYRWYDIPPYGRNNFTAFAQADYRPMPRLKLIAGGQVIKIPGFATQVTGGQSGTVTHTDGIDPRFVGRLGAVITFTTNLGAKVLYSEAFRQPSVVETDRVRYDDGEYPQEGNPDLLPEEISTTDLQVFYGNDRVNLGATLFDSRQSHVIVETEFSELIHNFNRFRTRGVELEARARPLKNVELTSALTYQKLNNDTHRIFDSTAVPVPSVMGKFGISYRTESGLTVGLYDSYFGAATESRSIDDEDSANTTQYVNPAADAFHNVTLNVAQRIGKWTPYVQVINLLNESIYYAEYTSVNINSIPGRPGRAVSVGMSVGIGGPP
jgi:outer membrane receptor protein involved in Fe transport